MNDVYIFLVENIIYVYINSFTMRDITWRLEVGQKQHISQKQQKKSIFYASF